MGDSNELLPGTLDMLVLRTLTAGSKHGYGIAQRLKETSGDVLHVGESSLYPALQRLLLNGWVTAEWGVTAGNRRARYYRLTRTGRKELDAEVAQYRRVSIAIERILKPA